VRIEPLQGRRQRLKFLNNAGLLAKGVYGQIQDDAQALETLFVMGTNRDALQEVEVKVEVEVESGLTLALTLASPSRLSRSIEPPAD